jgi:hypothetical protein
LTERLTQDCWKKLGNRSAPDYLDSPEKQAQVKTLENQIDQLVYKLYDLTSSNPKQYIQKMKLRDEPLAKGWVQIVHTLEEIQIVEGFNDGK